MLFPSPCSREGLVYAPLGLPAHLLVGKGRVCPDCGHVASPSRSEFIVEFQTVDPFEGVDKLEYGHWFSGTDVENLAVCFHFTFEHPSDSENMSFCKVYDVDIVPEAGPVRGGVVVPENRKTFPLSDCGLGDERNQIVGHSAGKLADKGGWMGADRVEIAEEDSFDLAVCALCRLYSILKYVFSVTGTLSGSP